MNLTTATRSELAKQFTTNIWWILVLILVVYVAFISGGFGILLSLLANGSLPDATGPSIPGDSLSPFLYSCATTFGYVFPLLIGALMVTTEFRHKTLTPTFLAVPRRGLAMSAKVIAALVMGLIFGIFGILASTGSGALVLALSGLDTNLGDPETWALLGRMLLAFALWSIIGLGLGTLVRNQVAAIVIVLAFTQFVEPIARIGGSFVSALEPIVRVLPGAASDALVGSSALTLDTTGSSGTGDPIEWWVGGALLLAYAVVFLVLGRVTSWRRDVD